LTEPDSPADKFGDAICSWDFHCPLGERARELHKIDLLDSFSMTECGRHLPDHCNNGNMILVSGQEREAHVRRANAAGAHDDGRPTRRARIAARNESCALLMASRYKPDVWGVEDRVERTKKALARYAGDEVDAAVPKDRNDGFSSGH
jgi:hypothetical protein